jgi:hypothetical protein
MNQPKHELYFSEYCKHSAAILEQLNRLGMQEKFRYISVDKRTVKNNITYIILPNGQQFPLPPMINRVPILLLKPSNEILSGNQILDYIKPQARNIQEQKTMIYNEPNPFAFSSDCLGMSGVMSDSFSFVESNNNQSEMKLDGGTAGMRQMYNYVTADCGNLNMIQAPQNLEAEKRKKSQYSLEDLEKMRESDFPQQRQI